MAIDVSVEEEPRTEAVPGLIAALQAFVREHGEAAEFFESRVYEACKCGLCVKARRALKKAGA